MSTKRTPKIEKPGILNTDQIRELIECKVIVGWDGPDDDIGKSSFDLHLNGYYWKLPAGIKCSRYSRVVDLIKRVGGKKKRIPKIGLRIFPDDEYVYLFELNERISLPKHFYGQGTGKSSIGRLDILTRLIVDYEEKYDCICPFRARNYRYKNLYVEVTPLSFPIKINNGDAIFQLRISKGDFQKLRIQSEIIHLFTNLMKHERGGSVAGADQTNLRLSLKPTKDGTIALKAKRRKEGFAPLKLSVKKPYYPPKNYWERIEKESEDILQIDGSLALKVEKNAFYILRSKERFILPDNIAVYGLAMTEEVGELRIHHAGFVHPGFGRLREDKKGTPLIFEVRGHDVNMLLKHGDLMAELKYYPMSSPAEKGDEYYEEQELKLSKIFKEFRNED
ncbi:hypothetical protein CEE37_05145 [candidate division LCP-89 bacterium B3_LCP]|uniref:Uncharacterized protein n=1 Tax=candidate division LCP-89 bacterium B3_LCP TaxID=2012998 RepID=A0A532V1F9_UNCL8|nr:MAG: hypothetical protein CEE37_05145 [candidate division LCP-89 bacterium B3_LCP]